MGIVFHEAVVTGHSDDALEALVIARRAVSGEIKPVRIHHGSLDTIANQIVGAVMGYGDMPTRRAYEIVAWAYLFRSLGGDDLRAVVREPSGNHLLWSNEDRDFLEESDGT